MLYALCRERAAQVMSAALYKQQVEEGNLKLEKKLKLQEVKKQQELDRIRDGKGISIYR